jgi:hypothetical protein
MKLFIPVLLFLVACSTNSGDTENNRSHTDSDAVPKAKEDLSDTTNTLKGKTKTHDYPAKGDTTLTLEYIPRGSPGAQWRETKSRYEGQNENWIYLEQASDKLVRADTLWDGINLPFQIQITGQFVSENGYPTGYTTKGNPQPARVFRYRKIKVIKNSTN